MYLFIYFLTISSIKVEPAASTPDHSTELWGQPVISPKGIVRLCSKRSAVLSWGRLARGRTRKPRIIARREQGGVTVCSCGRVVIFTPQACCIVALIRHNSVLLGKSRTEAVSQTHFTRREDIIWHLTSVSEEAKTRSDARKKSFEWKLQAHLEASESSLEDEFCLFLRGKVCFDK